MQRFFAVAALASGLAFAQPAQPKVDGLSSSRWRIGSVDVLTTGAGENQLGVTKGIRDERSRGANAIAISGKTIWVVDGENERMLKLGTGVARPPIVKLAGARSLVDLVPLADGVVGFDAANAKLMRIDKHGTTRELAHDKIDSFSSLVAGDKRTLLLKTSRKLMQIDLDEDEPPPPPPPSPSPQPLRPAPLLRAPMRIKSNVLVKNFRGLPVTARRAIDVKMVAGKARIAFLKEDKEEKAVEVDAPVAGRLVSTTLLGTDNKERSYYRLEVLTQEEPIKIERFIRILDRDGKQVEQISIPTANVIVPEKDIAIGADGSIAVLLPYEDKTVVARLDPP